MGIGVSSKRDKANLIGCKGLGCKAFLAVTDSFIVITRKNGKEWKFLIYKGELFPERTILKEKDTDLPNGVTIQVNISRYDTYNFINAIKEQTCYFKTCYYQIEGEDNLNNNKIYENELFTYSDIYPNSELHISFGPCHYPIDWKSLKIDPIYIPIALKIPITLGIDVHFNRESLVYNKLCKDIILDKIKQVSEWFVNKYNETQVSFSSLYKAWDKIGDDDYFVNIYNKKFKINNILKYSSVNINSLQVDNIKYIPLQKFKSNYSSLTEEYKTIGKIDGKRFKEKDINTWNGRYFNEKTLLLHQNAAMLKSFKEWLKTLQYTTLVKKDLSKVKTKDLEYYKQLLELTNDNKNNWRNIINEWITVKSEFIKELFVNGKDFHTCQAYLDFVQSSKKEKSYSYTNNYQRLNKVKGDITLLKPVGKLIGSGYKLEKTIYKLEKLYQNPYKLIILDESQKDLCIALHCKLKSFYTYKFAIATKGEIKKLSNIKNVQMFAQIEKKPNTLKLFNKIATAALYKKELEIFKNITFNLNNDIIKSISNNLSTNISKLQEYTRIYDIDYSDLNVFIDKCASENAFDLTLQSEYTQLKEFNTKFNFLQYMKTSYNHSTEDICKEINKQLIMRRLCNPEQYNMFDLVLKPVVDESLLIKTND